MSDSQPAIDEPAIDEPANGGRRALILVLLVLALGGTVRVVCWWRAPLIGTDAARFLDAAQLFEDGEHLAAVRDAYHPLTSYLIALTDQAQTLVMGTATDFEQRQAQRERAGAVVSIGAGLLCVLLLMSLARRVVPEVPPWSVGLLAATQPFLVRSSADIMSDTVFLACFLLVALQALRTLEDGRLWTAVSAGGAAGCAYLARPEGLVFLAVVPVAWALSRRDPRRLLAQTAVFAAAAAVLMVPYVLVISQQSGSWALTMKKSLVVATAHLGPLSGGGGTPIAAMGMGSFDPRVLFEILRQWFSTAFEPIALAALVGVVVKVRARRALAQGLRLLALLAGGMVLVLCGLLTVEGDDYLSRRHVFTLVALSLLLAPVGFLWVGQQLTRTRWIRNGRRAGLVLVILLCAGFVPKVMRAQRLDQLAQKEAGRWIRAHGGAEALVLSTREKVAYYAGATYHALHHRLQIASAEIRSQGDAWLVFYRQAAEQRCPGLPLWAEEWRGRVPGLELVASFEEPQARHPDVLEVYRWRRE